MPPATLLHSPWAGKHLLGVTTRMFFVGFGSQRPCCGHKAAVRGPQELRPSGALHSLSHFCSCWDHALPWFSPGETAFWKQKGVFDSPWARGKLVAAGCLQRPRPAGETPSVPLAGGLKSRVALGSAEFTNTAPGIHLPWGLELWDCLFAPGFLWGSCRCLFSVLTVFSQLLPSCHL